MPQQDIARLKPAAASSSQPNAEFHEWSWLHGLPTYLSTAVLLGLVLLGSAFFLRRNHLNVRLNGLTARLSHSRISHPRVHRLALFIHRGWSRFASCRALQLLQILRVLGLAHGFVAVLAGRQPQSKRHCHKSCRYFLHNLPLLPLVVRVSGSKAAFPAPVHKETVVRLFRLVWAAPPEEPHIVTALYG